VTALSAAQDNKAPEPKGKPDTTAANLINIDRMADDARRGLAFLVSAGNTSVLCIAGEVLRPAQFDTLKLTAQKNTRIHIGTLISARRAEQITVAHKGRAAVFLPINDQWRATDISAIGDPTMDLARPMMGPYKSDDRSDTAAEQGALKLIKIAQLLPYALCLSGPSDLLAKIAADMDALSATGENILRYDDLKAQELTEVARARLPMRGADNACIHAFRPATGGGEHLAIVIGNPDVNAPVLLRIHSACFTGDILGSLKCDCGVQLQQALETINSAGGGILLYMAQEGRGIGLESKLKAYALQDQGFDTVDANLKLGFDVDERFFQPAAVILGQLGVKSVRLMTNNPKKIAAMEDAGIAVIERVPHHFPTNTHNEDYLKTKKTRTGHLL